MVSVVVPIYNEEELVVRFHAAVANALQNVVDEWEVVYVNDGSTDTSLELLKGLQTLDSHVVVVELSRNWGHMGAISAGLHTARGRAVILMDGDFQDPPEVLPQLIDAWRDGAEVVVGRKKKPAGAAQDSGQTLSSLLSRPRNAFRLPNTSECRNLQSDGSESGRLDQLHGREEPVPTGSSSVGRLSKRHRLL